MDDILTDLISALASKAFYLALTSTLTGAFVAACKPFVIAEDQLRNRVDLHKHKLVERIRENYRGILGDAFALAPAPDRVDPVGAHVSEFLRVTVVINKLEGFCTTASRCYTCLFFTIAIGGLGVLFSWTGDTLRMLIAVACGISLIVQILTVYLLRSIKNQLREFEATT